MYLPLSVKLLIIATDTDAVLIKVVGKVFLNAVALLC
jgi:hypothetical protein